MIWLFLESLCLIIPLLIAVAFFTLLERKILSGVQRRQGPNVVGLFGLTQALADGLKLFLKECILPTRANSILFRYSPVITFILALILWVVVPLGTHKITTDFSLSLLLILAFSSLRVYGVLIAGWASNSTYAFYGALRSTAQIISYEVSIGFILACVILCAGSLNLTKIVESQQNVWFCFPLLPLFLIFLVSILAETNRHPFDLPEAEAELVSGYNVEYSAMAFALFFLGEYRNIICISILTALLFLGGWVSCRLFPIPGSVGLALKTFSIIAFFIWARAAYPRYRYDQLINLGWKIFLPFSIAYVLFTARILVRF